MAWAQDGGDSHGWDVWARRLDRDGRPLGPPFRVNTATAGDQGRPAGAVNPGGDLAFAWESGADGLSGRVFAANLAEGHGRSGRDRLHHWRIAHASAREVDTHLRLLAGAGAVDVGRARSALDLFDQVRAMTRRLLRPRG